MEVLDLLGKLLPTVSIVVRGFALAVLRGVFLIGLMREQSVDCRHPEKPLHDSLCPVLAFSGLDVSQPESDEPWTKCDLGDPAPLHEAVNVAGGGLPPRRQVCFGQQGGLYRRVCLCHARTLANRKTPFFSKNQPSLFTINSHLPSLRPIKLKNESRTFFRTPENNYLGMTENHFAAVSLLVNSR